MKKQYNSITKDFIDSLAGLSLSDMKSRTLEHIEQVEVRSVNDKTLKLKKIRNQIEKTNSVQSLERMLWNMLLSGEGNSVI